MFINIKILSHYLKYKQEMICYQHSTKILKNTKLN